jgi:hypothetical protein
VTAEHIARVRQVQNKLVGVSFYQHLEKMYPMGKAVTNGPRFAMSSTSLIILLVLLLTVLGSAVLLFITVKYYWGARGAPPATGEARRKQKEDELRLRQKQIEYAESHPRETRSSDFFDNRKQTS